MLTSLSILIAENSMSTLESNVAAAEKYLIRFKQFATGHFINGAFMVPEGNSLIDNISPIDQSILGQIAIGTDIEIDHACDAAQAAFPAWRLGNLLRCELLR